MSHLYVRSVYAIIGNANAQPRAANRSAAGSQGPGRRAQRQHAGTVRRWVRLRILPAPLRVTLRTVRGRASQIQAFIDGDGGGTKKVFSLSSGSSELPGRAPPPAKEKFSGAGGDC